MATTNFKFSKNVLVDPSTRLSDRVCPNLTQKIQKFIGRGVVRCQIGRSGYYAFLENKDHEYLSFWIANKWHGYAHQGEFIDRDGKRDKWHDKQPELGTMNELARWEDATSKVKKVRELPNVECSVCGAYVREMESTMKGFYECERGHANDDLYINFGPPHTVELIDNGENKNLEKVFDNYGIKRHKKETFQYYITSGTM